MPVFQPTYKDPKTGEQVRRNYQRRHRIKKLAERRVWMRPSTRDTPCGPATLPARRLLGHPNGRDEPDRAQ